MLRDQTRADGLQLLTLADLEAPAGLHGARQPAVVPLACSGHTNAVTLRSSAVGYHAGGAVASVSGLGKGKGVGKVCQDSRLP